MRKSHVEVGVEDPHLGDVVDGQVVPRRAPADRLGGGCAVDAGVVRSSSLTYECTQVTPSSAFRSITWRQSSAPVSEIGIRNPSGKLRCTTYRGIWGPPDWSDCENALNLWATKGGRIGTTPYVGVSGYLSWACQPEPYRLGGRFASSAGVELAQDRRDVMIDRLLRDDQPLCDLRVTQPFGQ
jgi:hypothetical protein